MRSLRVTSVVTTVAIAIFVSAVPGAHAQSASPGQATWLSAINDFRASLRLHSVDEDPAMSAAAAKHSTYMVETGFVEHGEKADSQWSTSAGLKSGEQSNVAGGTGVVPTEAQTVQMWVEAPFHRLGLMRPGWRTTGYSLQSATRGGEERWGATLNVIAGLTGSGAANWPVVWPNSRRTVDTSYLSFERIEWPDPTVGCPKSHDTDYGVIVTASFGPGTDIKVKSARLRVKGGATVPICVESPMTYKHDDYTDVGWRLLQENNTVMVLPRVVMSPGTTYQGRITLTDGRVAPILFTTAS